MMNHEGLLYLAPHVSSLPVLPLGFAALRELRTNEACAFIVVVALLVLVSCCGASTWPAGLADLSLALLQLVNIPRELRWKDGS